MRTVNNRRGYCQEIILDDTWDTARICPNGHVLTAHLIQESNPGMYCMECGEKGIDNCPNCSTNIRGLPYKLFGSFKPKKYCHECGKPYPWANKLSITNTDTVRTGLISRTSLVYWFYIARNKSIEIGYWLVHWFNSHLTREKQAEKLSEFTH